MALSRLLHSYLPAIAILLLGVLVFALLWGTRPVPEAEEREERRWPVATQSVEPREIAPEIPLYGTVEAPRQAQVRGAVAADVREVPVEEGQSVAAGDTLARLDEADLADAVTQRRGELEAITAELAGERARLTADREALEELERQRELAERALERERRLARDGAGTQAEVDAAQQRYHERRQAERERRRGIDARQESLQRLEAERRGAQAALDRAERDRQRAAITAPFSGRLESVDIAPGDRLEPGTVLARLYDPHELEVRATLPATSVDVVRRALQQDTPLRARGDLDGAAFMLHLDRWAGGGAERPGLAALFTLESGEPEAAKPGRFMQFDLALPPAEEVVSLPPRALFGENTVYRVADERLEALEAERRGWHRGENGQQRLLLRVPALDAGDRILTTALPNATEGLAVRTTENSATP